MNDLRPSIHSGVITVIQIINSGWIEGAAKLLFNTIAKASVVSIDKSQGKGDEMLHHAIILVELPEDEKKYPTIQQDLYWMRETVIGVDTSEDDPPAVVDENGESIISVKTFSLIWPYHMILDKKLVIRQCGNTLMKFCPSVRPGRLLDDVFEILLPRVPVDFYHFLNHVNVNFNIRVREKEGSLPLFLKGAVPIL